MNALNTPPHIHTHTYFCWQLDTKSQGMLNNVNHVCGGQ